MAISIEVLRADDLLQLFIDGENLRLDHREGEPPALVPEDPTKAAFMIVRFPPQTLVEEAVYESSPTPRLADETDQDKFKYNQPPPPPFGPPPGPPAPPPLPAETR